MAGLTSRRRVHVPQPTHVDPLPTPTPPVLEEYPDEHNPYRGTEMHGVEPTEQPVSVPGYDGSTAVETAPPRREPDPVAVRIVEGGGPREIKRANVTRAYVSGNPTVIAGRSANRTKCKFTNLESVRIWFGFSSGVGVWNGFPLDSNQSIEITADEEIWGVSDDGSTRSLAVLTEYSVEE